MIPKSQFSNNAHRSMLPKSQFLSFMLEFHMAEDKIRILIFHVAKFGACLPIPQS